MATSPPTDSTFACTLSSVLIDFVSVFPDSVSFFGDSGRTKGGEDGGDTWSSCGEKRGSEGFSSSLVIIAEVGEAGGGVEGWGGVAVDSCSRALAVYIII